jgi:hypothetical protein
MATPSAGTLNGAASGRSLSCASATKHHLRGNCGEALLRFLSNGISIDTGA